MLLFFLYIVRNRIKYRNKCVLLIQSTVRGFLARKHHRPRYQGISKINKIRLNAQKTIEIAGGLKKGREEIMNEVGEINRQIDETIHKIKVCVYIKKSIVVFQNDPTIYTFFLADE